MQDRLSEKRNLHRKRAPEIRIKGLLESLAEYQSMYIQDKTPQIWMRKLLGKKQLPGSCKINKILRAHIGPGTILCPIG